MRIVTTCIALICVLAQTARAEGYQILTNLVQLEKITKSAGPQRLQWRTRLEGTVLLSSSLQTILVVDGSDRQLVMPMDAQTRPLERGQRVLLEGNCVSVGAVLHLEATPLVYNDGVHSVADRSGGVFLTPGRHSLRVRYFDRGGDHVLRVYIKKPDSEREEISDKALFCPQVDPATEKANWVPGLVCRAFEGAWEFLPDFAALQPVQTAIVNNFHLGMLASNQAGLEFKGSIELTQEGYYEFSTVSDDGSDLYLDEIPLHLQVIGTHALSPLPHYAAGQILTGSEEIQCVEVDGVISFTGQEKSPFSLELTSGSGRTRVQILNSIEVPFSLLAGSRVRAMGICQSAFSPEGNRVVGNLIVPTGKQLLLLDVPHKIWTAQPVLPLGQLQDLKFSNALTGWLHVHGTFSPTRQSGLWQVKDATGTLLVETADLANELGELDGKEVEVMGKLNSKGVLQGATLRQTALGSKSNVQLPLLTTVEEVKQLSREDAQRGYPVKVRGVITFTWGVEGFFLQDGTWSIDVRTPRGLLSNPPHVGDYWEVDGVTFAEFAPDVLATRAGRLGSGIMPEPVRPTFDQLVNGSLDTLYIEVQGVVSSTQSNRMGLLTRGGEVKVQVMDIATNVLQGNEGALIRLRGCLVPARDSRQCAILGEFGLRNAILTVDAPSPADPFGFPRQRISDLLLFDSHSSVIQRVKLAGQFLQQSGGEYFFTDAESGLRLVPQKPLNLTRGDWVEAVGFPGLEAASPELRQAIVRRTGNGPLPPPQKLVETNLVNGAWDSMLVQVESRLVDWRENAVEQVLELQIGQRTYLARVETGRGFTKRLPVGCHLLLTGVYVAQGGDRATGREIDSFQLLLDSSDDVVVLKRPSWWTPGRRLAAAGIGVGALILSAIWIWQLRRRVERRTRELKNEIEEHKRTELRLEQQTQLLSLEVEQRKRIELEAERGHKQLLVVSRLAGMADVATSILHNVGNVLTNVNVLCSSIADRVRNSKMSSVSKLGDMLAQHNGDLSRFVSEDDRGRKMPVYVQQLGAHLTQEQAFLLEKISSLNENILHINQIVATQQNYAKNPGIRETVAPEEIVEDALRMHGESLGRHGIKLGLNTVPVPQVTIDRHKVLQILVNLLENAKHACIQASGSEKKVTIDIEPGIRPGFIQICVTDNGIGIPAENLSRIFAQGFSTRKDGHGFGLHSSILAAQDMGGDIIALSDGPGKGASFILQLPRVAQKRATASQAS